VEESKIDYTSRSECFNTETSAEACVELGGSWGKLTGSISGCFTTTSGSENCQENSNENEELRAEEIIVQPGMKLCEYKFAARCGQGNEWYEPHRTTEEIPIHQECPNAAEFQDIPHCSSMTSEYFVEETVHTSAGRFISVSVISASIAVFFV